MVLSVVSSVVLFMAFSVVPFMVPFMVSFMVSFMVPAALYAGRGFLWCPQLSMLAAAFYGARSPPCWPRLFMVSFMVSFMVPAAFHAGRGFLWCRSSLCCPQLSMLPAAFYGVRYDTRGSHKKTNVF